MDDVKHLLSFVSNTEGNMLSVHMDKNGISYLIDKLALLRQLIDRGECEHFHLFTADSIGSDLSSTKLDGSIDESTVVQQVKMYGWTQEWAERHRLLEPAVGITNS